MAKKILVVDDEPNILLVLASRLKANNFEVITASDGFYAVKKAREEKPDLIILDIRMPAGGGMSVFESLKIIPDTAIIPVIFITAHPTPQLEQKAKEMGAVDFISKPFDADELILKIKKALGEVK
ncbi:MAG: response regulator [Candidatus Aenigmatarchaeota archaeon]